MIEPEYDGMWWGWNDDECDLSFGLIYISQKIVLSQVLPYLNSHNLYNTFQSAYQPGHSTQTDLLNVVNDLFLSFIKCNMYIR